MNYLPASYNLWTVAASLLIASFASYVALDLAKGQRGREGLAAKLWWFGGSVAMGTGIWCMHFVGMLAFKLPIELGYTALLTAVSWVAAVSTSAVALHVAGRPTLTLPSLALGAGSMGIGICAMHYIGMAALDLTPGIVWDWVLVAASAAIAVGAAAAALAIFFWLRRVEAGQALQWQILAALVMGVAICGMHYTGMAAANFPADTVCLSSNALGGNGLGGIVALSSLGLLAMTLVTTVLDARLQDRAARLADSLKASNAQLQTANEELRRRAFLDPLTGLPNRTLFEDRMAHALQRLERLAERIGERQADKLAILFVDLDGFKPINDSLGHAAGDTVLKEVAGRLSATARDSDTVARLGGDEFVLLAEDLPSVADGVTLAQRLVASMAAPFEVAGRPVSLSCSVGVVVYPDHGTADKLLVNADAAMYSAKRAGGNTFAVFESQMDAKVFDQLNLLNDLRHAVENGEMRLHYQPKVDGRLGQIRGVEALLRWQHPSRGMVGPYEFIPLAERFGMIASLGAWVIDETCRQLQAWTDQGLRLRVSINLSVHQLRDPALIETISSALKRHYCDPSQLICEITETVAMEDVKATQRAIEALHGIGVSLAIDDFGTGYSSLSYLRQLPARQLKIDRSFVLDIEESSDALAVVAAIISLAHKLGLRVVAEGVETARQRDLLIELGCDELQGYYFARPMSAEALFGWSEGRKPEGAVDFSPSVLMPDPGA